MEKISVDVLKSSLETKFVGNEIFVFQSVSSTQDVARKLLRQGTSEGTVVLAEAQSGGRGRFGRDWFSPPGVGIWASLILHPGFRNSAVPLRRGIGPAEPIGSGAGLTVVSLTSSVAIANAIRKVTGLRSFVKWPNDVLLHQKKVAGILAEMAGESIIVGFGINVNQEQFPEFLRDSATSLMMESGNEVSRVSLIREVLHQLEYYYILLSEKGFSPVIEKMRDISAVLGRQVAASFNGKKIIGQAVDVDIDGALLIRIDSGFHVRVLTGDVQCC
jgi:BirA family biotin operon repressor/biotin-[acetyl-CoA-carboxylase] ligase